ncbi:Fic/DOC family protein [Dyella choica]|uniref:protein adenylyltransferase n=1 Tax=Dyella choica TaxID=1927959 RepID=A0A432M948_9GAMM|nr:Fic family protein [Dyella choica]RUL77498.1 cell filamentation protein Fic [Dyella choica]
MATSFDLKHLQVMREHLFKKVFDWVGELRTIDISKGARRLASWPYIVSDSKVLFAALARERANLSNASLDEFALRAVYYMGEINALHPFREGNGRTQREFISQLAKEAGYKISWSGISPLEVIAASAASMPGEEVPLYALTETRCIVRHPRHTLIFA